MFHFAFSVCDGPAVLKSIPNAISDAVSSAGSGSGDVLPFSISAELVSTSSSLCISICDSETMESEVVSSTPSKASSDSATDLIPSKLNSSCSC